MNAASLHPARHNARSPDNLFRRGAIWWIRYYVNGRKIRRSLGTRSLREAKRLRDRILAKRSVAAKFGIESPHAEPCKQFAEIAEMWLESRQADDSLAPSTRYQNARLVRAVLVPQFGAMVMSAITATAAGIGKHVTPHVFRHSFGTWVYEQTGDPKIVQRLMRHASFHTSMLYVHDRRDLGLVVNKLPNLTPERYLRVV